MKKQTANAAKFMYKRKMLTLKQIMNLEECTCSLSHLSTMAKSGKKIKDILTAKDFVNLVTKKDKTRIDGDKITKDKQIIKNAKADIKRQAAIKIMSVPIAEKTTCVYWLMKAYTYRSGSNMEPISLTKGSGY